MLRCVGAKRNRAEMKDFSFKDTRYLLFKRLRETRNSACRIRFILQAKRFN